MLGKRANPVCLTSFRKQGNGKVFAFELGMDAWYDNSTRDASIAKTAPGSSVFLAL
jgi:hypothetical protein